MKQVCIVKDGEQKTFSVPEGTILLDLLRKEEYKVVAPCGGNGTCGKCKVKVLTEGVPISKEDARLLSKEELAEGVRLSCALKVETDLVVVPYVETGAVILTENTKQNAVIGEKALEKRFEGGKTHVFLNGEKIAEEDGDTTTRAFGFAIDVGTTTVVCQLVDLCSNEVLGTESAMNAQRPYGADVISRIQRVMEEPESLNVLSSLIQNQLNALCDKLLEEYGVLESEVYYTVVAANTTMLHLLNGTDCKTMGVAPYAPVFTKRTRLSKLRGKVVELLPSVSAFVGADITAGMLACGRKRGYTLLVDLGTNGEIALFNEEKVLTSSTAAGPAFEGGGLACGSGAARGAVSHVVAKDGVVLLETIGNAPAKSICGSGVVDAVAQFVQEEIIDETGRFDDCNEEYESHFFERDGLTSFALTEDKTVFFSQKDVREVQLAKGAVRAGIELLLETANITEKEVERVCIAGGFGNFVKMESVLGIGMIPPAFDGKIEIVGNSALLGALLCLLSKDANAQIDALSSEAINLNLAENPKFQNTFAEYLMFE